MAEDEKRGAAIRLRLFVAAGEPNARLAEERLERIAEEHKGHVELNVVDIFEHYQLAIDEHIIAVPALVVDSPPPRRMIVGTMADHAKLCAFIGLPTGGGHE